MGMVTVIVETRTAAGTGMATETAINETATAIATERGTDTEAETIIRERDITRMMLMKTLELKGGSRRSHVLATDNCLLRLTWWVSS
jgi:hypothetical protein